MRFMSGGVKWAAVFQRGSLGLRQSHFISVEAFRRGIRLEIRMREESNKVSRGCNSRESFIAKWGILASVGYGNGFNTDATIWHQG